MTPLESSLTFLVKDLDRRDEPVELTKIAGANCKDGDCPTVYRTDRGTVDHSGPELPDHDFWLFDESTVVKLLYRPDGTQIGRELVEDPAVDAYLSWRDAAWRDAVPFGDYWAELTRRV